MLEKIISLFEKKGIVATWVGIAVCVPVNVGVTVAYFKNSAMSEQQLATAIVINIIGVIWFMLPSVIEIVMGKFKFLLKD